MDLPKFSDYIIFADESGSPTLTTIDPDYPIFVLVFCIIDKWIYAEKIQPAIKKLKFEFFGHDLAIIHAREIRKPQGDFLFLLNSALRQQFIERLNKVIADAEFHLVYSIVDKEALVHTYSNRFDPYYVALGMCLERTAGFLKERQQEGMLTHIIAESRGRTEDKSLAQEFQRIMDGGHDGGMTGSYPACDIPLELKFVEKKINSVGLQLADLAGHPIGRKQITALQLNRAYDIIAPKIWHHAECFPEKRKAPV